MEPVVNNRSHQSTRCCLVQLLIIGIIQITLGVIIMGIGIAVVDKYGRFDKPVNNNAAPIWSMFIFVTTGSLAICVFCRSSNKVLVNVHNIFAILSTVFAVAVIASAGGPLGKYGRFCRYATEICGEYGSILAFGILQLFLAIWGCIVGFSIHNCCNNLGPPNYQGYQNTNSYQMCPQTNQLQMQYQPQLNQMQPNPNQIPQQPHQIPQQPQVHQMTVVTGADGMQYFLVPIDPVQTQSAMQI